MISNYGGQPLKTCLFIYVSIHLYMYLLIYYCVYVRVYVSLYVLCVYRYPQRSKVGTRSPGTVAIRHLSCHGGAGS